MGCLIDPFGCVSQGFDSLLAGIPWPWVIGSLILGAALGKWGVTAVLGIAGYLLWQRRSADVHEQLPANHRDAAPVRKAPKRKIRTLQDIFKR